MNIILVHGGGHDSKCWGRLTGLLDAPARAIDLPGRGGRPQDLATITIANLVDAIVEEIESCPPGPVVLVGHSMAGISMPAAAARCSDRVAALICLSCMIPAEGQSIWDEHPVWVRYLAKLLGRKPDKPRPWLARRMFCNGMTEDQFAFNSTALCAEAQTILDEPVSRRGLPPASRVPRYYIRLLQDRALKPAKQDVYARNLGDCQMFEIDTCHNAMVSEPEQVAAIINRIVTRVADRNSHVA